MALTKISAGAHNVDTLAVGTSDTPPSLFLWMVVPTTTSCCGRPAAEVAWLCTLPVLGLRWPRRISFAVGGQYFQTRHNEPLQHRYEPKRPCNDAAAADVPCRLASLTTRTQPVNTFSGTTVGSTWVVT